MAPGGGEGRGGVGSGAIISDNSYLSPGGPPESEGGGLGRGEGAVISDNSYLAPGGPPERAGALDTYGAGAGDLPPRDYGAPAGDGQSQYQEGAGTGVRGGQGQYQGAGAEAGGDVNLGEYQAQGSEQSQYQARVGRVAETGRKDGTGRNSGTGRKPGTAGIQGQLKEGRLIGKRKEQKSNGRGTRKKKFRVAKRKPRGRYRLV